MRLVSVDIESCHWKNVLLLFFILLLLLLLLLLWAGKQISLILISFCCCDDVFLYKGRKRGYISTITLKVLAELKFISDNKEVKEKPLKRLDEITEKSHQHHPGPEGRQV